MLLWFAAMFASSGASKLNRSNLAAYVELLERYPLPRGLARGALVRGLGIAEIIAAAMFIATPLWPAGGFLLPALLAVFTALLTAQLTRDERIPCGCSGPADSLEITPVLVLRNLVYCGLATGAWLTAARLPALSLLLVAPLAGVMILSDGAVTALLRNSQRMAALRGQHS